MRYPSQPSKQIPLLRPLLTTKPKVIPMPRVAPSPERRPGFEPEKICPNQTEYFTP